MTTLMGEISAAEREADRLDILSELHRAGLSKTLERLMALGMNGAEAMDEVLHFIQEDAA